MSSNRALYQLAERMQPLDLEHMNTKAYGQLSKQWGVPIQDLMVANTIATLQHELGEVEELNGGTGYETRKATVPQLLDMISGRKEL